MISGRALVVVEWDWPDMPYKDPETAKLHHRNYQRVWQKKWRLEHPDEYREMKKKYKYPEAKRAAGKRYYLRHKKRLAEKQRQFIKNNPDRFREIQNASRNRHKDARNRKRREWRRANGQKDFQYKALRRAREHGSKASESTLAFFKFVRSQKSIPCYYCGKRVTGKKAHIDHVIALAKQGNHASENLCASCPECNLRKWTRLPSETSFNQQPLLNL